MFKTWINGWVKLHKEFNWLLLPSDISRLQKHSNSNTIKIIQIGFCSLSFLHCHQGLQIMDADTIKKASRKLSKKSCPPDNKNLLTELSMFFWHLVTTFWNLNRCIYGDLLKFSLYWSHCGKQGDFAWYFHLILSWPTRAQWKNQVYVNNIQNTKTNFF